MYLVHRARQRPSNSLKRHLPRPAIGRTYRACNKLSWESRYQHIATITCITSATIPETRSVGDIAENQRNAHVRWPLLKRDSAHCDDWCTTRYCSTHVEKACIRSGCTPLVLSSSKGRVWNPCQRQLSSSTRAVSNASACPSAFGQHFSCTDLVSPFSVCGMQKSDSTAGCRPETPRHSLPCRPDTVPEPLIYWCSDPP